MNDTSIELSEKTAALNRVLDSDEFAGAERLKAFLKYVVEQDLVGRSQSILGKTILEDVYRKRPDLEGNPDAVVRVDATRLRQRLEIYYGSEGQADPIRIHIDKGGYAPRFERTAPPSDGSDDAPTGTSPLLRVTWGRLGAVAALISIGIFLALWRIGPDRLQQELSPEARAALFENSPNTLLARNMASEARTLLFPAAETRRVIATLDMFESATRLDPNYYGGFAGAAQASIILAGMSMDPAFRETKRNLAFTYAERALELDSTKPWTHSARALVFFISRDFDTANEASLRALDLGPEDQHAQTVDAVIAMFSGDFARATINAPRSLQLNIPAAASPLTAAFGNSYYHLGDYSKSIQLLTAVVRSGGPVSEINTAHLIAAYQASGDTEKAANLVQAFQISWPESRLSQVLKGLFRIPDDADRVLVQMRAAGWTDPVED